MTPPRRVTPRDSAAVIVATRYCTTKRVRLSRVPPFSDRVPQGYNLNNSMPLFVPVVAKLTLNDTFRAMSHHFEGACAR